MKKTLRRGIAVLLFLALLSLSVRAADRFLDKTDVDEKYSQFFASETGFDVIFMGTSHMYNTVLPQELWRDAGIASYNWGQSNCTVPIDYYLLRLLEDYASPRLLVVDLFGFVEYADIGNGKYRTDARDQQRVQFDAFPLSKLKIEAVRDIFDDYENRYDFLFKFALYHSRWTEIKKDNFIPRNIPQKGAAFVLGFHDAADYRAPETGTASEIRSVGANYLDRLIRVCEERGIEVLFTVLPFVADQANADAAASADALLREKYGLSLLNLLNTDAVDYGTDVHADGSHLNYIGAAAVTKLLGQILAERYPELVRAGDPAYESWNRDYDAYIDYKISRFEAGKLYDNLALLYGPDFHGELTVPAGFDPGEDPLLARLIRRLGDSVSVRWDGERDENAGILLEIKDNRTGQTVFRDECRS